MTETVAMLTPEKAKALRNAAAKANYWLGVRDGLIREAVAEGGSLREVAEAVGLSHPGVKKIAERG